MLVANGTVVADLLDIFRADSEVLWRQVLVTKEVAASKSALAVVNVIVAFVAFRCHIWVTAGSHPSTSSRSLKAASRPCIGQEDNHILMALQEPVGRATTTVT